MKNFLISICCLRLIVELTGGYAEGGLREKIKEKLKEKSQGENPYPIIEGKFSSYIQSQYGQGDYRRFLQVNDRKRFYDLHISQNYNKEKSTPIVLVFHGGGGNPVQQRNDSQIDKVSDAYGFIVVYPAGTGEGEIIIKRKEGIRVIFQKSCMLFF
ncbi:MAG: hypothetical protein ABH873_02655 [Candidatus Firestonebacteria bacterium]